MPELYKLLSTTAGTGKYFGKGGGGIETAFAYFGELYGDQFAKYGLYIDTTTGNLKFGPNFDTSYIEMAKDLGYIGDEFTNEGLEKYLTNIF